MTGTNIVTWFGFMAALGLSTAAAPVVLDVTSADFRVDGIRETDAHEFVRTVATRQAQIKASRRINDLYRSPDPSGKNWRRSNFINYKKSSISDYQRLMVGHTERSEIRTAKFQIASWRQPYAGE